MSFDKNKYLDRVLESHKMKHVENLMEKYKQKREDIKNALEEKFSEEIDNRAINSGSYAKHTAINKKYDIDICQNFNYDSFDTLEEMADAVFDFFSEEYEDEELVRYATRKQRVSTGLTFIIDGNEIKMDIVPGRELSKDDYSQTNRLNLYVRAKGIDPATSTQTNIQKHIDLIKGKGNERNIIRLLKVWKVNKNKQRVKSFFIELITIRAFENASEIPDSLWEILKLTMEFIRDKVKTIRLEDPSNSNNIVSNTMTDLEKENLANDMEIILQRVEDDEEALKVYFSLNNDYDTVEEDNSSSTGATVLGTKSFS